MRYQLCSDLHIDHLNSSEVKLLIKALCPKHTHPTTLIIAGDIINIVKDNVITLQKFLRNICKFYTHVLYVPGNHEYYSPGHPVGYADSILSEISEKIENLHILRESLFVIEDTVIAGTTLWFDTTTEKALEHKEELNDFICISGGADWIQSQYYNALDFLDTLDSCDILVTHHGVTPKVHPKYAASNLNCYFYTDISDSIYRLQPKYVLHGHQHSSMKYMVDNSTVICNPYGYRHQNKEFNYSHEIML